jgi:hypothetical protein
LFPGQAVVGGRNGYVPRLAAGEVRFPKAVSVVPPGFAIERSQANRTAALRLAAESDCDRAAERWRRARNRMLGRTEWLAANRPAIDRALADCWVAHADRSDDSAEQAKLVRLARSLDPQATSANPTAHDLAAHWFERGIEARENEDWIESYRSFSAAVDIDPRLAWARRYAEEARIHRLALRTKVRAW